MRLPQVRFTLRRAMLGIVVIAVLLGIASWARRNIPISYQEIPTRVGPPDYRAYYADGSFSERVANSGRWVRSGGWERDAKSGRWVIRPGGPNEAIQRTPLPGAADLKR